MSFKILLVSFFIFLISSCTNSPSESDKIKNNQQNEGLDSSVENNRIEHKGPVIGERIDGPANIRSKPNGKVLFSLNDWTLVEATEFDKDWCRVLVGAEIPESEFGLDSMVKGRKLKVNGVVVGEVIETHEVSSASGYKTWAYMYGYTHRNNIYSNTIIENVLLNKIESPEFDLTSWKEFINKFELDTINYKEFDGLTGYYNYENSIEDPSPGYRVVLLFENNSLIGVIHSRKLNISSFKTTALEHSYYLSFLDTYPKEKIQRFKDYITIFINSVD